MAPSLLLVIFYISTAKSVEFYREKPHYIEGCKLSASNFSKCYAETMRLMYNQLLIGIPEVIAELGPLDPYHFDNLDFEEKNMFMDLVGNYSNIVISGSSNMTLLDYRINTTTLTSWSKFITPRATINAKYKLIGRVLLLPFNCSGHFNCLIEDLMITLRSTKKLYKKDGFVFLNVTSVESHLNAGNIIVKYNNYFGGTQYPEVDQVLNELINDNWREFFQAVQPLIERLCNAWYLKHFKTLYKLIPYNFIIEDLPEIENLYQKEFT